jgi:hypothetical protein
MQTFLTFPDFAQSAQVLDNKRLGKQRVETLQIVLALRRVNLDGSPKTGRTWADHPIGRMWSVSHLPALILYQFEVTLEWAARGFKDTCWDKTVNAVGGVDGEIFQQYRFGKDIMPWWVGQDGFHRAHQSNLVRKDPVFYTPLFPDVPNNLAYHWPAADVEPYELKDQPSPFLPVLRDRT